jgi:glycosyltransferase involved in cell wall biosynthesis
MMPFKKVNKMKLSIVTPILNEEKRLKPFIERIANQTVPPEMIFVDGGSKDGTLGIIRSYQKKHKNIKIIPETGDVRNIGNARNVGYSHATGDVACSFDIDFILEKDFTEKVVREFEKHPKYGIIRFMDAQVKPKFVSTTQKAFYYRDNARWMAKPYTYILKRELIPKTDVTVSYGEDKLMQIEIKRAMDKLGYFKSDVTLTYEIRGYPFSLMDVWKRYRWYGRTGITYYNKTKDSAHLMKMVLAVLSIPFFPLMIIPAGRGFYCWTKIAKDYPAGIITMPLIESIAFPAMAVGFWMQLLKGSKKTGH